jgi:hypothetical protein
MAEKGTCVWCRNPSGRYETIYEKDQILCASENAIETTDIIKRNGTSDCQIQSQKLCSENFADVSNCFMF